MVHVGKVFQTHLESIATVFMSFPGHLHGNIFKNHYLYMQKFQDPLPVYLYIAKIEHSHPVLTPSLSMKEIIFSFYNLNVFNMF